MIDGNFTEFTDKLYYGEELLFEYHNKLYFIQGWIENSIACMVLDERNKKSFEGYLWECKKNSMRECAEIFLNEKMWNGKNFIQIEKDVIWKD